MLRSALPNATPELRSPPQLFFFGFIIQKAGLSANLKLSRSGRSATISHSDPDAPARDLRRKYAHFPHTLPQPVVLLEPERGEPPRPFMRQSVRDVYVSSGLKADYSDARQVSSGDAVPVVAWARDNNLLTEQGSSIREISPNGELKGEIASEKESAAMQPNGCSDGHLVFARRMLKTLSVNIWRSEADGTGLHRLTEGKRDMFPMCSPAGKTVFYMDMTVPAYMRVSIDGGQPERVTKDFAEFNAGFDVARDGKTVVLGIYDFKAQRPTISLVSLDSGQVLRMFEYDPRHQGQPRFSPDGKGIVYPVREKGVDNLWLQPLDGGPGRQLTNFGSLKIYSYQWSPDGKSLALVRGDSPSDLVLIQNSPGK
jgi:WD40-like Beta Propeller Repeat